MSALRESFVNGDPFRSVYAPNLRVFSYGRWQVQAENKNSGRRFPCVLPRLLRRAGTTAGPMIGTRPSLVRSVAITAQSASRMSFRGTRASLPLASLKRTRCVFVEGSTFKTPYR